MEIHLGRLIDHVHLRVGDFDRSRSFYRALLRSLGRDLTREGPGFFSVDELFVTPADPESGTSRIHLAFQAPDRETVDRCHAAALAAGARDNGSPGERPYHPGYYGAYLLDPDGNNVEIVNHGAPRRSAASVVLEP